MPVTVEKLPDEPIILVTAVGEVNAEIMRDAYKQIAAICETIEGPIYRITDVRKQVTTFAKMMQIVQKAATGEAGTTTDPRIRSVFVGRDYFTLVGRDMYNNPKYGGQYMPVFDTIEAALEAIRSGSLDQNQLKENGESNP
jgi:hypothetical protein